MKRAGKPLDDPLRVEISGSSGCPHCVLLAVLKEVRAKFPEVPLHVFVRPLGDALGEFILDDAGRDDETTWKDVGLALMNAASSMTEAGGAVGFSCDITMPPVEPGSTAAMDGDDDDDDDGEAPPDIRPTAPGSDTLN